MAYTPGEGWKKNLEGTFKIWLPDGVNLYLQKSESMDPAIGEFYGFGLSFSHNLIGKGDPFEFLAELLESAARQIRDRK